jgi:hypothetical protein
VIGFSDVSDIAAPSDRLADSGADRGVVDTDQR